MKRHNVLFCLAALLASPVFAQTVPVPAKAVPSSSTAVVYDRYAYEIAAQPQAQGAPVFLDACNAVRCVGPTGQPIGTLEAIATQLPAVKAQDVTRYHYDCRVVCYDAEYNLIGRAPLVPFPR